MGRPKNKGKTSGGRHGVDESVVSRLFGGAKDGVLKEAGIGDEEGVEESTLDDLANLVIERLIRYTVDNPDFMYAFVELINLSANSAADPARVTGLCVQMVRAATPPTIDPETQEMIEAFEAMGKYDKAEAIRRSVMASGAAGSFTDAVSQVPVAHPAGQTYSVQPPQQTPVPQVAPVQPTVVPSSFNPASPTMSSPGYGPGGGTGGVGSTPPSAPQQQGGQAAWQRQQPGNQQQQ